ncbi:type II secretion system F family protein [Pseudomonas sp. GX19020]|uniref:type II secretion system F family protein n=1 Tax=Pseudomonadota TaxID=1224 RepID=UPI000896ABD5|nr:MULTISPECIES: type II secretion system F family protein [Pseudomonadota]MCL4065692.1 type II secretion system F family protein [Pseudomonas sp. GX19020]SEB97563.1 tight adherence protein C [Rhodobacter sp. 24-YEA-8]
MLQSINSVLTGLLGPLGPLIAIAGLGIVLVLIALPTMLKKQRDRFAELGVQAGIRGAAADAGKSNRLRRMSSGDRLEKYAHLLEPQKAEELSALRLKLMRAGYPDKGAVRLFHAAKMVLGLGGLVLGVAFALINSTDETSTTSLLIYGALPGVIGYYLPVYWIEKRVAMRQTEIIQGFPDALDMMLVCVEAGQSLDQSIIRVGRESRAGYPALADEFDLVAQEVKAGKERTQVLRDMSDRVGIPDVASFVTTLVQSATFGTPVAEALRVYSADMRDKRVMRAEEKANMLPTKLTLGTMMFTVPPLLIILIGPSVWGIVTMLGQMGGK